MSENQAPPINVRSPEYKLYYANNVKVSSSPLEFRITFNAIVDDVGVGKFVNQEQVCIVMANSAVKPMLEFIAQMVKAHEAKYGAFPEMQKEIKPSA